MALLTVPWTTPGLRLTSAVCAVEDFDEFQRQLHDVPVLGPWSGILNGKRVAVQPPDLDMDSVAHEDDLVDALQDAADDADVDLEVLGFFTARTSVSYQP